LTWGGAFVVLALAAPVAKHAVQVEYEEGILIWLALPLVLAAGLHLDGDDAPPLSRIRRVDQRITL
jgi:hypothetical protein